MRSWHPWLHFRTITRHKLLVMKYCFRIGLYKQGLLHDLSKYSPTEFLVGCKYYQGTRSPNNAEREATGVSMSWLHHKGRNRHHFEHWVDYSLDGEHVIMGARMPRKYVAEMVMDRISGLSIHRQRKSWRDFSESWINTERIRPCGISAMYIYVITAEKK